MDAPEAQPRDFQRTRGAVDVVAGVVGFEHAGGRGRFSVRLLARSLARRGRRHAPEALSLTEVRGGGEAGLMTRNRAGGGVSVASFMCAYRVRKRIVPLGV